MLATGALSTIGIACGHHLELLMRQYINSGGAAEDMRAIADHRADYERGRTMAEGMFAKEPAYWLPRAPLVGSHIVEMLDWKIGPAWSFNAFNPPFEDPVVAKDGLMARMAELVRDHYGA